MNLWRQWARLVGIFLYCARGNICDCCGCAECVCPCRDDPPIPTTICLCSELDVLAGRLGRRVAVALGREDRWRA